MTRQELEQKLEEIGISKLRYSIYEGLKEDALILDNISGTWKISYVERGEEHLLKLHTSESEAFDSLLELFVNKH